MELGGRVRSRSPLLAKAAVAPRGHEVEDVAKAIEEENVPRNERGRLMAQRRD